MKYKLGILVSILFFLITGCKQYWEDYYNDEPITVDANVWEAMQDDPEISLFVGIIKEFQFDTLFTTDNAFTVFTPVNEAVTEFLDTGLMTDIILNYHFAETFMQPSSISGKRKVQTLDEKFSLLEFYGQVTLLDGVELDFESPLYKNGKYFKMGVVASPKPNLYEYITLNNPILKRFIDLQDSIILDKELSRPIGFNEDGNTVYDTVSETINMFEEEYFPVSEEYRAKSATLVFPKREIYNAALDVMAEALGGTYIDHNDIPYKWQEDVLIPHLLYEGVFDNMLEEIEFAPTYLGDTVKLKNILGDSVVINYFPTDKVLCSNGYAYSYSEFEIVDSLYMGSNIFEAEWLLRQTGLNKFEWLEDEAYVISDVSFPALKNFNVASSNDTLLKINFTNKYAGKFELNFKGPSLFPRKYLMVVKTHMDIGGIYNVYVNEELVKTFDYYDFLKRRGLYTSVTGKRFTPQGRFNIFDCWVESVYEYEKVDIRFEYIGPGFAPGNGLVLDYIEFVPETGVDEWLENYK